MLCSCILQLSKAYGRVCQRLGPAKREAIIERFPALAGGTRALLCVLCYPPPQRNQQEDFSRYGTDNGTTYHTAETLACESTASPLHYPCLPRRHNNTQLTRLASSGAEGGISRAGAGIRVGQPTGAPERTRGYPAASTRQRMAPALREAGEQAARDASEESIAFSIGSSSKNQHVGSYPGTFSILVGCVWRSQSVTSVEEDSLFSHYGVDRYGMCGYVASGAVVVPLVPRV